MLKYGISKVKRPEHTGQIKNSGVDNMKKLNVRMIMMELGYSETSWKASRTRLLKKLNIENASDVVMVDVPVAERLIELVQEVKAKQLIANKLLGSKKYLEFTEEEKATEPKKATSGTGAKAPSKATITKTQYTEMENKVDSLRAIVKHKDEEIKKLKAEIEKLKAVETEYKILKAMAGE